MDVTVYTAERWDQSFFETQLADHNVTFTDGSLQEQGPTDSDAVCIFINSTIGEEELEQMPNLELICTMSTGFDHVDLDACEAHDVTVCNVPSYGQNTVAEHTFALLLSISRKLYPSIERTHEAHRFDNDASIRGWDLKDKTIGIIGTGDIGAHVARIADGFDMDVLAYDVYERDDLAERIGFDYVDLPTIYDKADVLTLHVPLNDATHHLLDEEAIERMNNMTIINTSRGAVVDTDALIRGLNNGNVCCAGLDVLEGEQRVNEDEQLLQESTAEKEAVLKNHMLMRKDNVVITPHNAYNSVEALRRIVTTTAENIDSYAVGEAQNTV